MGEIITINFLNIHLDYASIFWNAEGQGGQEKERECEGERDREREGRKAGIAESLLAKWHHKIGSLLFCLQSTAMPGGVLSPLLNGGNELCNLLQMRAH